MSRPAAGRCRWGSRSPAPRSVRGRLVSAAATRRGSEKQRRVFDVGLVGPQALVLAEPVVDPGALAPLALVDRALQAAQVAHAALGIGALVGDQPDTAHAGVDLAAPVWAYPTARAAAQLLGAGHRAGIGGHGQRALAAHAAGEQTVFDEPLHEREGVVERRSF